MTGRRCYDHLGGRLGAALLELYLENGWLEQTEGKDREYRMTDAGKRAFAGMGLPVGDAGDGEKAKGALKEGPPGHAREPADGRKG